LEISPGNVARVTVKVKTRSAQSSVAHLHWRGARATPQGGARTASHARGRGRRAGDGEPLATSMRFGHASAHPVRADTDLVFDPATYVDGVPFAALARLRRERPVVRVEERASPGWP